MASFFSPMETKLLEMKWEKISKWNLRQYFRGEIKHMDTRLESKLETAEEKAVLATILIATITSRVIAYALQMK